MSVPRKAQRLTRSLATQVATPNLYSGSSSATTSNLQRESTALRTNWTKREVEEIYRSPLLELVFRAATVHRNHHDPKKIQLCTLMNIKSQSHVLLFFR